MNVSTLHGGTKNISAKEDEFCLLIIELEMLDHN